MPRYALLRHTGAPDDPSGCHFDLLLEDGATCRTWRLADVPTIDAAQQDAVPLPAHRLVWLDPRSAAVSGGRGWAERIGSGRYKEACPPTPTILWRSLWLMAISADNSGSLKGIAGSTSLEILKSSAKLR